MGPKLCWTPDCFCHHPFKKLKSTRIPILEATEHERCIFTKWLFYRSISINYSILSANMIKHHTRWDHLYLTNLHVYGSICVVKQMHGGCSWKSQSWKSQVQQNCYMPPKSPTHRRVLDPKTWQVQTHDGSQSSVGIDPEMSALKLLTQTR